MHLHILLLVSPIIAKHALDFALHKTVHVSLYQSFAGRHFNLLQIKVSR